VPALVEITPLTAPLLGIVPVNSAPALYAVLPIRISEAIAVASEVSAS
jgi:hypothetical protein